MTQRILRLACGAALLASAFSCKTSTSPSDSRTTTSTSSITTTSTVLTTTTIPSQTSFTVSGLIFDASSGAPLRGADVEIISGVGAGRRFQSDNSGNYAMPNLSPGNLTMRVFSPGYSIRDVGITITNADVRQDVGLTPVPLKANFIWSPDPCTMIGSNPAVNCRVDGSGSTGNITSYSWVYGARTGTGTIHNVSMTCGDFTNATATEVFTPVTLTVRDASGATSSITQSFSVKRSGGACGFQ
jgi:hypothetical protein